MAPPLLNRLRMLKLLMQETTMQLPFGFFVRWPMKAMLLRSIVSP
jgi:hypothetical protein